MKERQLLKSFVLSTLTIMVFYSLTRLLFFFMNPALFASSSSGDILLSFFYGLRFDLSALAMNNGLLFLIFLLFGASSMILYKSLWVYFAVSNGLFLGLNILDTEFYKFNGKRVTADYLQNTEDIQRHTLSAFLTYWWLFSIFAFALFFLFFLFPRLFPRRNIQLSWKRRALYSLVVVAFTIIGVRGGLQFKPISLVNAYKQGHQSLGALVLNTPFAFVKGHSANLNEAPVFEDFLTAKEKIEKFRSRSDHFSPLSDVENVIVIVVESLSLEYTGLLPGQVSYTPFLDQLKNQSLAFTQNYANGRRSIEAMPSIFCGIPSLTPAPIITSSLSQNELHCLPEQFGAHNFTTAFFHGAHNGSFHMDSFASKAGFQKFYGFDEFPESEKADDGHWGILDEPMLTYMVKELSSYKAPFFAGVFTLSSHHPYFIPEFLRDQLKEGPLEIHKSIGYADYALKRFFEEARKTSWFQKTLFLIIADHTQKNYEKAYQFFTGAYRVPLLIYSESPEFKERFLKRRSLFEGKVTQAVDIPSTVTSLMGISVTPQWPLFGHNIFDEAERGLALNFDGYQYWLRFQQEVVAIDRQGQLSEHLILDDGGFLKDQSPEAGPQTKTLQEVLKAFVSYFNQSMRQNSLYKNQ